MAILLNGSTSVSVSEASPGIELGTLSGGNGTYQLYFSDDTYTEIFNTDAPSRFAATSKDTLVRVEFSKNRLTTEIPFSSVSRPGSWRWPVMTSAK